MNPKPCRSAKSSSWTGDTIERRRLIVIRVITVQDPIDPRNADRRADSRIGRILAHQSGVMRKPQAEIERQPGRDFVLILHESEVELAQCFSV